MQEPEKPIPDPEVVATASPTTVESTNQEAIGRDLREILLALQSQVAKDIIREIETD